ncbi:MAG: hypothetical protein ACPGVB_10910, partial [Chitinophagales bacterium]
MIDLYNLAIENETIIQNELRNLKASNVKSYRIEKFQKTINKQKKASINVSIEKLYRVFKKKQYKNVFELNLPEAEIKEKYDRNGKYFSRFSIFVNKVLNGKDIKYAALNIGSLGFNNYFGECCITLKSTFLEHSSKNKKIVCLNDYSLKIFNKKGGKWIFDENKLKKSVARWENVDVLTTLKHHTHLGENTSNWSFLVCGGHCTEVLIYCPIKVENFEKIQIRKKEKSLYGLFLGRNRRPIYQILSENNDLATRLLSHLSKKINLEKLVIDLNKLVHIDFYFHEKGFDL